MDVRKIKAYNVKLGIMDVMKEISVIRTPIMKEGVATEKYRYRLAGKGQEGVGLSRFVTKEDAKDVAKQLKLKIQTGAPSAARRRRTCEVIGKEAEEKCIARRAKKAPAKPRKASTKTSSAKTSSAKPKKASAKTKAPAKPKKAPATPRPSSAKASGKPRGRPKRQQ